MMVKIQKLLRAATTIFIACASANALGATPPQQLEAEDASLSPGFVVATNHAGFSGSGFVDYVGEGYVEWTVNVADSSSFQLSFRYALASGDRPLDIVVNGTTASSNVSFPATGAWSSWGSVTTEVTLNAGTNTVRAQTRGVSGANMDRLDVTEVSAETPNTAFVAKSGGDYTDPIQAINDLNAWCTPQVPGTASGCTMEIGPGVFDLDSPLIVPGSLDITGSGQNVTTLRSTVSSDVLNPTMAAVVVVGGGTFIEDLTILNRALDNNSVAVLVQSGGFLGMDYVIVSASEGADGIPPPASSLLGIANLGGTARMRHVYIVANASGDPFLGPTAIRNEGILYVSEFRLF